MTLEDHAGDIIRKARNAEGVSAAAAAAAAGINEAELAEFEETGLGGRRPDFHRLAPLLALTAAKLERVADGWLPRTVETCAWREIRLITTSRRMSVNCFLVWDESTREAALFDTGWDAGPIFEIIAQFRLQLEHLFLTHTHEDHIAALGQIRGRFPGVRLHAAAQSAPAGQKIRSGDLVRLGRLEIEARETPGHAEDGMTYVVTQFPEQSWPVAVVGDCIFAGSIGRGFVSTSFLKQKVREEILSLPDGTLLCPGHGPLTTVAEEKGNNPFF